MTRRRFKNVHERQDNDDEKTTTTARETSATLKESDDGESSDDEDTKEEPEEELKAPKVPVQQNGKRSTRPKGAFNNFGEKKSKKSGGLIEAEVLGKKDKKKDKKKKKKKSEKSKSSLLKLNVG